MSTDNIYLAVFMGSKTGQRAAAWAALTDSERERRSQEGRAAWGAWMQKHQASVLELGGPLGRTKRVSEHGIEDVTNQLAAFVAVRAQSHEAAAKLFENHPHFTIFPGDAVEVMPVKPVPGT